jgi:hypothetical protein
VTFAVANDSNSRGRQFADEAEVLLGRESNHQSIAFLQGLYALFAYEGNLGNGSKSVTYFLQAIDVFNALNGTDLMEQERDTINEERSQKETEAMSWVLWGLYATEW